MLAPILPIPLQNPYNCMTDVFSLSRGGQATCIKIKYPEGLFKSDQPEQLRRANQLETQLRVLIEGSAEKIFPSSSVRADLAHQLVQAMHEKIRMESDGSQSVPNLYTLTLPPQQALALQGNPQVLNELAASLEDYARQAGLHLHGANVEGNSLPKDKVPRCVYWRASPINLGETAQLEVVSRARHPPFPWVPF
jgi:hypothetical protein